MERDLLELAEWAELPPYVVSLDAPDPKLDAVTELAVKVTDASIGGISLIFQSQIWLPSRYGVSAQYLPRAGSFCTWAVKGGPHDFEVPDATADPRFSSNPLVATGPHLRHYAAAPLRGHGHHLVGTLWVMSTPPRTLTREQYSQLHLIADIAANMLAARYCDPTTGMYNRNVFLHHLQYLLERRTADAELTVGYVNVAGLRLVNDVHGRAEGDRLLRQVGERMVGWAGIRGLLGHLGGARFAFALSGSPADTAARIDELCRLIDAPLLLDDGNALQVRARIGIWRQPVPHMVDASNLLDAAEAAATTLEVPRERSVVREYDSTLKASSRLRYELNDVIRGGGSYGQLEVHYQPQVDTGTGRLIGLEALVRWRHPVYGLIGPDRFVPRAEALGDIVDLDLQVMERVCRDLRDWAARGLEVVPVALNLSRASLLHSRLLARLHEVLADTGVAGHLLEFEVTESLLLDSLTQLQESVTALRALGVRISIDDFGTGYSNLDALNNLPFDRLKADRRFVDGVAGNDKKAGLFLLIKGIAELSAVELLCEGVEHEDDLDWLQGHGVHRVQGWYFSAAGTAGRVETWLARFSGAPGPLPVQEMRALLS